ncbi:DUF2797 domain-containing protein [Rhodococcoides corynebacterioides]|uniref:DUF2797 domain-containing protein n=1 Tax=Rhodococcoides corynebacterioides TaxID=53972 RepID=UPI0009ED3857|nr:DUF2797 domain-containing protein [Rhodococcus corynebacterioides]MBY6362755.1 DUF2797 domain-containing protein [Rhodococcus corynebacterioides]
MDRHVVRGVQWPGPRLALTNVRTGETTTRDVLGSLRYRAIDDAGIVWCIGRRDDDGRATACPRGNRASSGVHCADCAAADPYRFVHIVHRQNFLSKSLERVVLQPHWLYVATFAGGETKVGTAADPRKSARLLEQGALVGRYVARAVDGRVVRILEDAATDVAGLRQAVRASAKAAGLARPVHLAALDAANADAASFAREVLREVAADPSTEVADDSFSVVDERWEAPTRDDVFSGRRSSYPLDPGVGTHGLDVRWGVGSAVGAEVTADPGTVYVADLSRLRGRRVEFGDYETALPAVQEALF